MADIDILKFNLQETQFPYFSDADLQILLDQYGDVQTASYQGCLIKAQDDSIDLGPIKTVSNEKYWLRQARLYRGNCTGIVQRVDEGDVNA
jgi:hypothetical protein